MNAFVRGRSQIGFKYMTQKGSFLTGLLLTKLLDVTAYRCTTLRAREGGASRLARLIELLAEECTREDAGKELIIRRMLEVLLVEVLRRPNAGNEAIPAGLVKGMRLPGLARALSAMHANIRANWTVAELAGIAGMSRSAFAARFHEMLGCAPIEYLARWRMTPARDALMRGVKSLDDIADEIGYESASAFSTAFRRRTGVAPGSFARANSDRH